MGAKELRTEKTYNLFGFALGWRERKRLLDSAGRVLSYALVIGLSLVFSVPFLWMVSTSLKTEYQLALVPPQWIPRPPDWGNYTEAMFHFYRPIYGPFVNTMVYTLVGGFGVVLSSCIVAYGFARLPFKGRDPLFIVVLSTMMLPGQVTLIPQYVLFKEFGWLDSYKPLIVPSYFGSAFYIFLLRQFFLTIPKELDEAALIDGASRLGIFWRIMLPLSRPILVTVIAFTFLAHWDDFFGPLIYLNTREKYNLALWVANFRSDAERIRLDLLMAGSVIMNIPVVLVFLQCQRYFITGITMTGLKEG